MSQAERRYWLLKTEPHTFSLDDLRRSPKQTTTWDGVRNYQARNILRDAMAVGDGVLIYHSCAQPLAIVGRAEVTSPSYADPSQFDPLSPYFDGAATAQKPRWFARDITFKEAFGRPVLRHTLAQMPEFADLMLLRRGSRLSVQPVSEDAWGLILALRGG
jgi:predicted RNA-binding protein with PUA-like domain